VTLDYDETTALLVVDVQNDFADPRGSLSVPGGCDVIDAINAEVAAATAAGALVVYTQDWHPPVTPHFEKHGGVWPEHCVRETWGAELHPELVVVGPSVRKATGEEDGYSGFSTRHPVSGEVLATQLDDLLNERDIERVVVVGHALDYCVKETALDARTLGYETLVPLATTAPVEVQPGDGAKAIDEMVGAGVTILEA
jgi:nicotinamidase/pyrazinamidase